MSEEQRIESQIEESPTADGQKPDGAKNTESKVIELTQEEMDEIIAKRVARERKKLEKFADYEDVKAKALEYEKLLEEKRLAEMSEKERLEELAKKHESEKQSLAQELEKLREQNKQEKINNEFLKQATKSNIEYIDAAIKLADFSAVEVDGDSVKGVDDVIKSLVESNPFLLSQKQTQPQQIGRPSNPNRPDEIETLRSQLQDAKNKKDFNRVIELDNRLKNLTNGK